MSSAGDDKTAPQPSRPARKPRWWGVWLGLAAALVLGVAAGLAALASFNPNAYAPALEAAVQRATGRPLTMGGKVRLRLSLNPTLTVSDVVLGNPPGDFTGEFVEIGQAEAQIALLPLLAGRLDVLRLVLVHPQITLQRLPSGASNWDFSAAHGHAGRAHHFHGYRLALEQVQIRDGHVTLIPASGRVYGFALPDLSGTAASLSAPLHLAGGAQIGTRQIRLSGVVGPISWLSETAPAPWPVEINLSGAGATARLNGAVAHPRLGTGYDLALHIDIPALDALAPGSAPALRDLHLAAHVADTGAAIPAIRNLSLTAGPSDLSSLRPGLRLQALALLMPSLSQPLTLQASGQLGAAAFSAQGQLGPLAALFAPPSAPGQPPPPSLPVALAVTLGNAQATLKGAIATPATLSGAALGLTANIPDLSALAAAIGAPLPGWKNITLQTTLTDPGGQGLRNAIGADSLTVSMDHAQFGGDASLTLGAQPKLDAALKFSSLDLDALAAAMPAPAPPLPGLAALHLGDADIQLAADSLVWRGFDFSALQTEATLSGGVLTIASLTGQLPGGAVTASASLDAATDPAAETLRLTAPALALSPLLRAVGLPDGAEGTARLSLKAASTGDTLPAIAAGLNGSLGVAAVNGTIDGTALRRLLGGVLRTAGLTDPRLTAAGPVPLRCAALRVDATNGTATLSALALDTARLTLRGAGTADLGKGTLALTLQPEPRGQSATPSGVTVSGSFTQPALASAAAAAPPAADLCPAALALARFGQPGPAPLTPASLIAPAVSAPAPGAPKNLNSLLGQ
ncbi:AsmA family protein [Acidocella sp. KAb 2-4]|uniref:AsmA family protein n=1 Tax=Acidocella sp. KAb 2-4 TaxID=2885158 RepID=UPI001D06FFA3|nr:AsmA family protein [Acidocella sp. KAb 2-4]MCB5943571.1 AsmA family protein [Acidocella sp. KAb 2-4]